MKTLFLPIIFLVLTGFAFTSPAAAQQDSAAVDRQVLKEILAELKQLRSTIARVNVNQVRFQTAFDQYKLQQNRVDSMTREIESLKNFNNNNNAQGRATAEEQIKQTEERMQQLTDPRQRQTTERTLSSMKRNLEMQEKREKQMKDRQTDLETKIVYEQSKLDTLNAELERIKQDINSLMNNQ